MVSLKLFVLLQAAIVNRKVFVFSNDATTDYYTVANWPDLNATTYSEESPLLTSEGCVIWSPDENSRSYSSVWNNDKKGTWHARSGLDSPQAWTPAHQNTNQWMSIELDGETPVTGLKIQKRSDIPSQYVKKFGVFYSTKISTDSSVFDPVYDQSGSAIVKFEKPIMAVSIKIQPLEWNEYISMRVGLINCGNQKSAQPKPLCKTINPPESRRVYSSVWGHEERGVGHARSELGSPQAWTPDHSKLCHQNHYDPNITICDYPYGTKERRFPPQWMILDLENESHSGSTSGTVISGLKIQKRADYPDQHVTKFQVYYTNEILPCFSRLAGCDEPNKDMFSSSLAELRLLGEEYMTNKAYHVTRPVSRFPGYLYDFEFEPVYDQSGEAEVFFSETIEARYVKIEPTEWSQYISMRVGAIQC